MRDTKNQKNNNKKRLLATLRVIHHAKNTSLFLHIPEQ